MFAVGEYIVYGTNGICRVEGIGPAPYDKSDTRVFYLLVPVNNPLSSTIIRRWITGAFPCAA